MDNPQKAHLQAVADARYSHSTLVERTRVIATLPPLDALDRATTQEWWRSRQTRGDGQPRAAVSLSAEKSHAREYWIWCRQQGLLDHNPADWIPKVRQSSTKAVTVGEGDLYRVIQAAPEFMRRMIALASMAGLRSAEIAIVTWEDIDRGEGVLRVRNGKGAKDRTVPLSAGLLAELGDPGTGPIIGRAMTAKSVSAAIGRHLRRHGVNSSAHKLRARYATRFLAVTGDAVATAEVLGHSGLGSVMRYAVASSDTMRRGAEAAGRIG